MDIRNDIKKLRNELNIFEKRLKMYEHSNEKKKLSTVVKTLHNHVSAVDKRRVQEIEDATAVSVKNSREWWDNEAREAQIEWDKLTNEERDPENYITSSILKRELDNALECRNKRKFMNMYKTHKKIQSERYNEKVLEIVKHIKECVNITIDSCLFGQFKELFNEILGRCDFVKECDHCHCGYCDDVRDDE
jgi:hypothetical protein